MSSKEDTGTRKALGGNRNWFTASSGTRLKEQREKKAFQRSHVQRTDQKIVGKHLLKLRVL